MRRALHLDRRSLLRLSGSLALAIGLPACPGPVHAAMLPSRKGLLVLADQRYAESLRYAASFKLQGAEILPVGRDLARLWSQHIEPRLSADLASVAGLTLASDLFGLERLAEGSGAVTVFAQSLVLDHAPCRGRPRHFLCWRMGWGRESLETIG